MKRILAAVLMLTMCAGSAQAAGKPAKKAKQAGGGTREVVERLSDGENLSIHQNDILTYRKYLNNQEKWFGDKCGYNFSSRQGSGPGTFAALKGLSEAWAEQYPGTKLNCAGGAGTLVLGGVSSNFSNGIIVKTVDERFIEGVVLEVRRDTYSIKDSNGNYVACRGDEIIDIKLPIQVTSQLATMGKEKGLSISSNEMIEAANEFRNKIFLTASGNPGSLMSFSAHLLLEPDYRDAVIDKTLEMAAERKASGKPMVVKKKSFVADFEPGGRRPSVPAAPADKEPETAYTPPKSRIPNLGY